MTRRQTLGKKQRRGGGRRKRSTKRYNKYGGINENKKIAALEYKYNTVINTFYIDLIDKIKIIENIRQEMLEEQREFDEY